MAAIFIKPTLFLNPAETPTTTGEGMQSSGNSTIRAATSHSFKSSVQNHSKLSVLSQAGKPADAAKLSSPRAAFAHASQPPALPPRPVAGKGTVPSSARPGALHTAYQNAHRKGPGERFSVHHAGAADRRDETSINAQKNRPPAASPTVPSAGQNSRPPVPPKPTIYKGYTYFPYVPSQPKTFSPSPKPAFSFNKKLNDLSLRGNNAAKRFMNNQHVVQMASDLNHAARAGRELAKNVWQSLRDAGNSFQQSVRNFHDEFQRAYAEEVSRRTHHDAGSPPMGPTPGWSGAGPGAGSNSYSQYRSNREHGSAKQSGNTGAPPPSTYNPGNNAPNTPLAGSSTSAPATASASATMQEPIRNSGLPPMDMSVPRTRAEWNEIVKTWHKDGFGKSQMGTLIKEMQEKNKPSGKEKELLEMQFMHKYKNFFTGSGLDQYSEEDRHGADNYANMLKALNVFKRY